MPVADNTAMQPPVYGNKRRLVLLSSLILSVVTLVLLLIAAEVVLRVRWKEPYMFDRRLMFFSEGHNFENKGWGGFAYGPNEPVHAATYYVTDLDAPTVEREYEYRFTSNSLGWVQHSEPDTLKQTILFLGDSFTEGQGAVPWFYTLESRWPQESPYQLINGGILATGVEGWTRVYNDLAGRFNITKAVIIFIGDDWHRVMWQFPKQTLACLQSASQCIGDENFYGMPSDSAAARAHIDRIAQFRIQQLKTVRDTASFVHGTAVYKHLWTPLRTSLKRALHRAPEDPEAQQLAVSKRVMTALVNKLGRENVLFIYLPQRHELDPGPNLYGKLANDFVTGSGYSLIDGRAECGLTAADYHPHDGHPNPDGYKKIEACVERAATGFAKGATTMSDH